MMLEQKIIGRTIEDIKSNNSRIIETRYNLELYEEYLITDNVDTIICGIDEDNKLILIIDL